MLKLLLAPLAWVYATVASLRNKLFDWDIIKHKEYDIPVVCVGNITVGGTGKTPVSELLIDILSKQYNVALLSRGYKRKSKGYQEVLLNSSYLQVGDEPKQIKHKFPNIIVAVCEKRAEGIAQIREQYPEVNLIILDDAFQHRYIEPWVNILLMDYNRPIYDDHFLPMGSLRDSMSQLHRADVVLVTKCPDNMKAIESRIISKNLNLYPYQKLYYAKIKHGEPTPIFKDKEPTPIQEHTKVIAMSGIANPTPFTEHINKTHYICESLIFPDHHSYMMKDLKAMSRALTKAGKETVIITTEKDAVKLTNAKKIPIEIQRALYYIPIEMEILDEKLNEFTQHIQRHVKSNQKYSIIH